MLYYNPTEFLNNCTEYNTGGCESTSGHFKGIWGVFSGRRNGLQEGVRTCVRARDGDRAHSLGGPRRESMQTLAGGAACERVGTLLVPRLPSVTEDH